MSTRSINIKLITKSIKNLRFHFSQVTTLVSQMTPIIVILWKEQKNLQKRVENLQKSQKIGFMKTGCSKKKDHLKKIKMLWRANYISKDRWRELYIEKLSYNLTK